MAELTKDPLDWMCEVCGARYAEYVNGCPHCWSRDETRAKVSHQPEDFWPALASEGKE